MLSAEKLKQLRVQHGWTQEQLATISGISTRTVQRIEQTGECSLESKMAIAAAFNVKPQWLNNVTTEPTDLLAASPAANAIGWGLFISFIVAILYFQGEGSINARPHINALTLVVTLAALSVRTIDLKSLGYLIAFSFGRSNRPCPVSTPQAIMFVKQLINFTYLSAIFAFFFHVSLMTTAWSGVSLFYEPLLNIIFQSAFSAGLYAIFIAEFIFRTAKLRLENLLLASYQLDQ